MEKAARRLTLVLERLNLELLRQHIQTQIMSQAVEIMRTVEPATVSSPVQEEAQSKLIQVLECGLLWRGRLPGMSSVFGEKLLQIRALLREDGSTDVEGLLVLAHVYGARGSMGIRSFEVVRLFPVDRGCEGVVLGLSLHGPLWERNQAGLSCC